jgi:uncharacterized protein YerC
MSIDRKLSEQEIYTVLWLRRGGRTMYSIAQEVGCSISTVARVEYKEGAYAGYDAPTGELTEQLISIIRAEPATITYAELAEKYMLSQSTAMRVWRGEGRFTDGRYSKEELAAMAVEQPTPRNNVMRLVRTDVQKRGKPAVADELLAERVRKLYNNGKTYEVISMRMGVSPSTVGRIINRVGAYAETVKQAA